MKSGDSSMTYKPSNMVLLQAAAAGDFRPLDSAEREGFAGASDLALGAYFSDKMGMAADEEVLVVFDPFAQDGYCFQMQDDDLVCWYLEAGQLDWRRM